MLNFLLWWIVVGVPYLLIRFWWEEYSRREWLESVRDESRWFWVNEKRWKEGQDRDY